MSAKGPSGHTLRLIAHLEEYRYWTDPDPYATDRRDRFALAGQDVDNIGPVKPVAWAYAMETERNKVVRR